MRLINQFLALALLTHAITALEAQVDPNARGIAAIARSRAKTATSGAVYAADFGAQCDGTTDDAPAINAATDAIRNGISAPNGSWPIGHIGRLVLPRGTCVIKSTLNWANLYGSGFAADLWGTLIDCRVTGGTCIDMTATGQANILGLNLAGNQNFMPQYGLVLARRTASLSQGADHNFLDHPTISGYFTLTPYYNRSSETTHVEAGMFLNFQPNAYAAIFDGSNHFNFQSAFTPGYTYPVDTFSSFNENTCVTCIFTVLGQNSVAVWLGGTERHKIINSYIANAGGVSSGAGNPAVVMWFGNGVPNDYFMLDAHIEDQTLGAGIEFQGATALIIKSLRIEDPTSAQSGPYFRLGAGVTSVNMQNADISIGLMYGTNPSWWSLPSAFVVSGKIYAGDNSYSAPNSFTGMLCLSSGCTPTIVFPSNLSLSSISNPGGVANIALSDSGAYLNGASNIVSFSAPSSGGQQASATISQWQFLGYGNTVGGTGYQVNDVLYLSDGTPAAGPPSQTTATGLKVTAVDSNGKVTGYTYYGGNGIYTALPPTGGSNLSCGSPCHGSGMSLDYLTKWIPNTFSIIPGAGYLSPPTVIMPIAQSGGRTATATATLSSTLSIQAGLGAVALNSSGTTITGPTTLSGALTASSGITITGNASISGSATIGSISGGLSIAGGPLKSVQPIIDQSRVRVTATGSALTIPAATSWYVMVQTGTVSSQNIVLPTPLADGQQLRISTVGQITSVMLTPQSGATILGWTNGATMAANTSVSFGWDATSSSWQRLQ